MAFSFQKGVPKGLGCEQLAEPWAPPAELRCRGGGTRAALLGRGRAVLRAGTVVSPQPLSHPSPAIPRPLRAAYGAEESSAGGHLCAAALLPQPRVRLPWDCLSPGTLRSPEAVNMGLGAAGRGGLGPEEVKQRPGGMKPRSFMGCRIKTFRRRELPVRTERCAMEPPGTAGAPGAAGRPWDEAKAFYDNLTPKKKPKSVRAAAGAAYRLLHLRVLRSPLRFPSPPSRRASPPGPLRSFWVSSSALRVRCLRVSRGSLWVCDSCRYPGVCLGHRSFSLTQRLLPGPWGSSGYPSVLRDSTGVSPEPAMFPGPSRSEMSLQSYSCPVSCWCPALSHQPRAQRGRGRTRDSLEPQPLRGFGDSMGAQPPPLGSGRLEQSLCYLTRAELCWV